MESAETPGDGRVTRELSDEDWLSSGSLLDSVAIDIGVEGGIVLDEVFTLYGHCGGCRAHLKEDVQADGYGRGDVDILDDGTESSHDNGEMVGIKRHIGELEVSGTVRGCGPRIFADRVLYGDGGSRHDCARRICNSTADGTGVRLCEQIRENYGTQKDEKERENAARRYAHGKPPGKSLIVLLAVLAVSSEIRRRSVPVAAGEEVLAVGRFH